MVGLRIGDDEFGDRDVDEQADDFDEAGAPNALPIARDVHDCLLYFFTSLMFSTSGSSVPSSSTHPPRTTGL